MSDVLPMIGECGANCGRRAMKLRSICLLAALSVFACARPTAPAQLPCASRSAPQRAASQQPVASPAAVAQTASSDECRGRVDYAVCGNEEEAQRCIQGECLPASDCAHWCGKRVAQNLASELASLLAGCKGSDAANCRAQVAEIDHPARVKAASRSQMCLTSCGYPSLTHPPLPQ